MAISWRPDHWQLKSRVRVPSQFLSLPLSTISSWGRRLEAWLCRSLSIEDSTRKHELSLHRSPIHGFSFHEGLQSVELGLQKLLQQSVCHLKLLHWRYMPLQPQVVQISRWWPVLEIESHTYTPWWLLSQSMALFSVQGNAKEKLTLSNHHPYPR